MKTMKRALRRHHRERMLKKRYNQLLNRWVYNNGPYDDDWLYLVSRLRLHTPCGCSCPMCGNPRRTGADGTGNKSLTLQERRNLLSFEEQVGVY